MEAFWALLHCFNRKSVFINVIKTCSINFALKLKHRSRRSLKQHSRVNSKYKFWDLFHRVKNLSVNKVKWRQTSDSLSSRKWRDFCFTNSSFVQIRYKLEILLPCFWRKDTDEKQAQRSKTKHCFDLLHRKAINVIRLTSRNGVKMKQRGSINCLARGQTKAE